jgi:hypothetical protein
MLRTESRENRSNTSFSFIFKGWIVNSFFGWVVLDEIFYIKVSDDSCVIETFLDAEDRYGNVHLQCRTKKIPKFIMRKNILN